jgi:hypothetical protein
MSDYLIEPGNAGPKELYEKYSKEIDDLIRKTRAQIQKDAFLFTSKKKSFFIPLVINISAILLTIAGLFLAGFFFNLKEQDIISHYAGISTVEGKILLEYKQQTEEKLRRINNQIGKIEQKLLNVTEEKNDLLEEIDSVILERQKELELQMTRELEEERVRLQGQGLSEELIEERLKELELAKQNEIDEYKESLRTELEHEYEAKQAGYLALLNEYEETLSQVQSQREYLEDELEENNKELEKLKKHISKEETPVDTTGESGSAGEYRKEEELVLDQIASIYREIKESIENLEFYKADEYLTILSEYVSEDSIIMLPAVRQRIEFDKFIIGSLKKLIEFETLSEGYMQETATDAVSEIKPDTAEENTEYLRLVERLNSIESEFNKFFADNPGIISYASEDEFIGLVGDKLLVKKILSTDPIASEYPGLADKLEKYYVALGNEKSTTGQYYALLDVLDLLENLEKNSSRIQYHWENINDEDVKNTFLQIIQKLKSILSP